MKVIDIEVIDDNKIRYSKTKPLSRSDKGTRVRLTGDAKTVPGLEIEFRAKAREKPDIREMNSDCTCEIPRRIITEAKETIFVAIVRWGSAKKVLSRAETKFEKSSMN